MKLAVVFALLLQCIGHLDAFSLTDVVGGNSQKRKKPKRSFSTETSELFNQLQYYETTTISHNQLHLIDDTDSPVYPTNGMLQFDAFGRVELEQSDMGIFDFVFCFVFIFLLNVLDIQTMVSQASRTISSQFYNNITRWI